MSTVDKPCYFCGKSCVGQPRGKDPQGRYYHIACLEAHQAQQAERQASEASSRPEEVSIADELSPADEQALLIEVSVPPVNAAAGQSCAGCGQPLPDGAIICLHCGFNQTSGRALKSKVRRAQSVGSEPDAAEYGRWIVSIGSLLVAAVIAVATLSDFNMVQSGEFGEGAQKSGALVGLALRSMFMFVLVLGGAFTAARYSIGVSLLRFWAIVQLALASTCGLLPLVAVGVLASTVESTEIAEAVEGKLLGAIVMLGLTLLWPIVVLIWQHREKDEFESWR